MALENHDVHNELNTMVVALLVPDRLIDEPVESEWRIYASIN